MNKYTFALLVAMTAPISLLGMQPRKKKPENPQQALNRLNIEEQKKQEEHWLKVALQDSLNTLSHLTIDQQTPTTNNSSTALQSDEEFARKLQAEDDAALSQHIEQLKPQQTTATKSRKSTARQLPNTTKKSFSNPHVECIQALPQQGATCGMHAACNAMAIHLLLSQQNPVTHQTVGELNQHLQVDWLKEVKTLNNLQSQLKNKGRVEYNDLEIKDIASVIDLLKEKNPTLENMNVFFLNNQMQWAGAITGYSHEQTMSQHAYEIALQEFKEKDNGVISFICNTGGHWVTVCAIKSPGKQPHLYYMDSVNGNPAQSGPFFAFILPKIL